MTVTVTVTTMNNAAAPKSITDTILDKLQPSIHMKFFGSLSPNDPHAVRRREAFVANCDEALRVLQVRRAVLMSKKNTQMVRVALVIDYLIRNVLKDASINPQLMANVVGFQKKDMKRWAEMQMLIASYLNDTSIGKQSHGKDQNPTKRRKKEDNSLWHGSATIPSSSTSRPALSPSNLIGDLSIQLGPLIPDAEFVVSYAARLFQIFTSLDGMDRQTNKRLSRYALQRDMAENQEYYEAAFLFLAAKKSEGEKLSHLKKASKKKLLSIQTDSNSDLAQDEKNDNATDEEEDDVDENRSMSEADVIRAANELQRMAKTSQRPLLERQFVSVLNYVQEWIDILPADKLHTVTKTKGSHKSLFEPSSNPTDNVYRQWKQKVLQDAKVTVSKKIKGGEAENWLTIAANEVLHKAYTESTPDLQSRVGAAGRQSNALPETR